MVVCPNCGHPALTSEFWVYALCICNRYATKIINHHSKSKTIVAKLIFTLKNLHFVNDEVWAGCSKLGYSTLAV